MGMIHVVIYKEKALSGTKNQKPQMQTTDTEGKSPKKVAKISLLDDLDEFDGQSSLIY